MIDDSKFTTNASEDKVDIAVTRVRLYISLFSSHKWGKERCFN